MKSISGILGAIALLLLLATVGAAMFPEHTPNWMIVLSAAVVSGVMSVVTARQLRK